MKFSLKNNYVHTTKLNTVKIPVRLATFICRHFALSWLLSNFEIVFSQNLDTASKPSNLFKKENMSKNTSLIVLRIFNCNFSTNVLICFCTKLLIFTQSIWEMEHKCVNQKRKMAANFASTNSGRSAVWPIQQYFLLIVPEKDYYMYKYYKYFVNFTSEFTSAILSVFISVRMSLSLF